ncbi:YihY/virulence factor BrkB family protein [Phenylobacterium deserti]|uniref:YihY/virulence factor BrkB family protein n=1 Tax=Phenylobacterium deserti TaxID=1914756 RepID=UPI001F0C8308|nr:YihY/virulence factor BrkB family protein [Phenylobacterium deserti]
MDWDPLHWLRIGLQILGRSLTRLWGRDVMLYTGGASFFVMLAIFPALAILIAVYSLVADPARATLEGEALARLMPVGAREIFRNELLRLAETPYRALSTQSGLAAVIGMYAAHRGFKALLAGLSFIHDEDEPRGFLGFNLMALGVLIATFAGLALVSTAFFSLRVMGEAFNLRPLRGASWLYSEWTWASASMVLGLACIYRFAMSSRPVIWRASLIGGMAGALLCLSASWAIAFYVQQIAHLGATYGSIATVVIFLIWLSWNVNAIFFGGALATEVELALGYLPVRSSFRRTSRAGPRSAGRRPRVSSPRR